MTVEQQRAFNAEVLGKLTARMAAARLVLAHRELGAGLDVNPRTKVRYAAVEEQRARDVARAEARELAARRERDDLADRRLRSAQGGDDDAPAPAAAISASAAASIAAIAGAGAPPGPGPPPTPPSLPTQQAAMPLVAVSALTGALAAAGASSTGGIVVSDASGGLDTAGGNASAEGDEPLPEASPRSAPKHVAWNKGAGGSGGRKAAAKVSQAEAVAGGMMGLRALTESEGLFHSNVVTADPTALNRGGFRKKTPGATAALSNAASDSSGGSAGYLLAKGAAMRQEYSFDSAAELYDTNEKMQSDDLRKGKKKKAVFAADTPADVATQSRVSSERLKADADAAQAAAAAIAERQHVRQLFVPGGPEVEAQRKLREKILESKLRHVQTERVVRTVEEVAFDPLRSTLSLAAPTTHTVSIQRGPGSTAGTNAEAAAAPAQAQERAFPELCQHLPKIMRHVACKIALSYDPRKFAYYFLSPTSNDIVADCFWLVHTRLFAEKARQREARAAARLKAAGALAQSGGGGGGGVSEDSADAAEGGLAPEVDDGDGTDLAVLLSPTPETLLATEILVDSLALQSFEMLKNVSSNKYLFAYFFPFAVAAAVHNCFVFLLPGSKGSYTLLFKLEVFAIVTRLLSGVELAPITISRTIDAIFPDERPSLAVRDEMREQAASAAADANASAAAKKKKAIAAAAAAASAAAAKALENESDGAAADGGESGDAATLRAMGDKRSQAWARAMGYRSAFDLFKSTSLADRALLGLGSTAKVEILRKLDRTTIVPASAFLITGASVPQAVVTASGCVTDLVLPVPAKHREMYGTHGSSRADTAAHASRAFLDGFRGPSDGPDTGHVHGFGEAAHGRHRHHSHRGLGLPEHRTHAERLSDGRSSVLDGGASMPSASSPASALSPSPSVSGTGMAAAAAVRGALPLFSPINGSARGAGGGSMWSLSSLPSGASAGGGSGGISGGPGLGGLGRGEGSHASPQLPPDGADARSRHNHSHLQAQAHTHSQVHVHGRHKHHGHAAPTLQAQRLQGFLMHPHAWERNTALLARGGKQPAGENDDSDAPEGGEHSHFQLDADADHRRRIYEGVPMRAGDATFALRAENAAEAASTARRNEEAAEAWAKEQSDAADRAMGIVPGQGMDGAAGVGTVTLHTSFLGLMRGGLSGAAASATRAGGARTVLVAAAAIARRRVHIREIVHMAEVKAAETGFTMEHAHSAVAQKLHEEEIEAEAEVATLLREAEAAERGDEEGSGSGGGGGSGSGSGSGSESTGSTSESDAGSGSEPDDDYGRGAAGAAVGERKHSLHLPRLNHHHRHRHHHAHHRRRDAHMARASGHDGLTSLSEMTRLPPVGAELAFKMLVARSRQRPLLVPFIATSTSTLLQRALPHVKAYAAGQPVAMHRTVPVPWSRFGGVETFRSVEGRIGADAGGSGGGDGGGSGGGDESAAPRDSHAQIRAAISHVATQNEKDRKKAMAGLQARRDEVLSGGPGAVAHAAQGVRQARALKQRERLAKFEQARHDKLVQEESKRLGHGHGQGGGGVGAGGGAAGGEGGRAHGEAVAGGEAAAAGGGIGDRLVIDRSDPGMRGATIITLEPTAAAAAAAAAKYTTRHAVELNLFNLSTLAKITASQTGYAGDPLAFAAHNKTQARMLAHKEAERRREADARERARLVLLVEARDAEHKAREAAPGPLAGGQASGTPSPS